MYTICKRFTFEASHQLEGLPEGHKCGRTHGHSYKVDLYLQSEKLDEVGFVIDFGELGEFKEAIDETLDHTHLNDSISKNPTAENIAKVLWKLAVHLKYPVKKIRVWETEKCWAEYEE